MILDKPYKSSRKKEDRLAIWKSQQVYSRTLFGWFSGILQHCGTRASFKLHVGVNSSTSPRRLICQFVFNMCLENHTDSSHFSISFQKWNSVPSKWARHAGLSLEQIRYTLSMRANQSCSFKAGSTANGCLNLILAKIDTVDREEAIFDTSDC